MMEGEIAFGREIRILHVCFVFVHNLCIDRVRNGYAVLLQLREDIHCRRYVVSVVSGKEYLLSIAQKHLNNMAEMRIQLSVALLQTFVLCAVHQRCIRLRGRRCFARIVGCCSLFQPFVNICSALTSHYAVQVFLSVSRQGREQLDMLAPFDEFRLNGYRVKNVRQCLRATDRVVPCLAQQQVGLVVDKIRAMSLYVLNNE